MSFFFRIILSLALIFAASCTGRYDIISDEPMADSALLHLCLENKESDSIVTTRSNLSSTAPEQEVISAYLYIFEGTGADARLVACEDLKWELGMVQKEYRILYNFDKSGATEYVLMAVGLDDSSKEYYTLSADPDTDLTNSTLTLSTLRIEAKSLSGISESEFFVGESTVKYVNEVFTQVEPESSTPTVEMKRRVSGVLLYVTDIPCDINSTKVTHLTLEANKPQRKGLVLHRNIISGGNTGQTSDDILSETGDTFTDSDATQSQTLMTIAMPSDGYVAGGTYTIAAPDPADKVQRLENTWLKGVYMLPLEDVSMTLNLYGEGNAEPLLTLNVLNEAGSNQYSIQSNHVYSIGQKLTPDNTLDDVPVSLAADKIVLRPVEWTDIFRNDITDISKNEDFFEPTNPYGLKLLTNDGKVSDAENYIFNCIANTEGQIMIRLPKAREGQGEPTWELEISYPDKQNNDENNPSGWLYLKNGDTWTEAVGTFSGSGDITYDMFMTDYATVPTYVNSLVGDLGVDSTSTENRALRKKYDDDYRIAMLTLSAEDSNGETLLNQTLIVKQFNAIVFKIKAYDCGTDYIYPMFSRLDVGDKFDIDGSIIASATTHEWGFHDIDNNESLFYNAAKLYYNQQRNRYLGLNNTLYIKTSDDADTYWSESAASKCWKPYLTIRDNVISDYDTSITNMDREYMDPQSGSVWYFPAAAEMFFLFQLNKKLGLKTSNIRAQETYWSSSPKQRNLLVYPVPADANVNLKDGDIEDRSDFEDYVSTPLDRKTGTAYYLRQASLIRVE